MKCLSKAIAFVLFCVIFIRCTSYVPSNEALANAILEESGDNRAQLEQVIEYYKTSDIDAEKLQAAYFLIGNIMDNVSQIASDSLRYERIIDTLSELSDPYGFRMYLLRAVCGSVPRGPKSTPSKSSANGCSLIEPDMNDWKHGDLQH